MFNEIMLYHYEGVDLIPSDVSLSEYESRSAGVFRRDKFLKNRFEAKSEVFRELLYARNYWDSML